MKNFFFVLASILAAAPAAAQGLDWPPSSSSFRVKANSAGSFLPQERGINLVGAGSASIACVDDPTGKQSTCTVTVGNAVSPLTVNPGGALCDASGFFCWTTVGGLSGLTSNGASLPNLYTTGTSQVWITTTDFSPNPTGGTTLGGTQPFGSVTGGVFISERGNSPGVFGTHDSTQQNHIGVQMVGGAGGNGYLSWGDNNGPQNLDTGIWRSGVGELSVSSGSNSGNAGNLKANTITATTYSGLPSFDAYLGAYDTADNSTSNPIQTFVVAKASTLADAQFTTSVVGVGGGSYVVKLCSDGSTCSGANLKATLTVSCTAAVGTKTALTINNATIAAAATLTLQPSTACGTTAESGNFVLHLTQ